jgi:DNA gyrase subunit B
MTSSKSQRADEYTASDIQVLEGLEAVRRRPGMYIGSTDSRGLHHLIYEIVDNGVDEAMAGVCDRITINIHEDGVVQVTDDGRGIPVDIHPTTKRPALETIMTTLHAGGKFGGGAYKVSGGLHGVGASVVNALSEHLTVEVQRGGRMYRQEFARGKPIADMEEVGDSDGQGTSISFLPDSITFGEIDYNFSDLVQRFREMAYLNRDLTIEFSSPWHKARGAEEWEASFHFELGISSFVQDYLNRDREVLSPKPIHIEKAADDILVEVALQYNTGYSELVYSFANCINTPDGGTHLTGLRTALTRALNDYARKKGAIKEDQPKLAGEDVREGLAAVISVKLLDPEFEGQTKAKLGNPEVRGPVETIVAESLEYYLDEHPQEARRIIDKCLTSQKARDAARKARDMVLRKNAMDGGSLPGLLADCQERNPENSELFLVEGPSAGGSAKMGRDRGFQAILPLKGKILNVEKAREEQMIAHEELRAIITVLGTKFHSRVKVSNDNGDDYGDDEEEGEENGNGADGFDLDSLRYHKVIIMTDADVDGSHIRTLLLTFFYRHMRPLVEGGYLYIAQPPLYKASKGKSEQWLYSDDALEQWSAKERYSGLKLTSKDGTTISGADIRKAVDPLKLLDKTLAELQQSTEIPAEFMLLLLASSVGDWYRQGLASPSAVTQQTRSWLQEANIPFKAPFDKKRDEGVLEIEYPEATKFTLTNDHFESSLMRRCFDLYPAAKAYVEGQPYLVEKRNKMIQEDVSWRDLTDILEESTDRTGVTIQRYKGLGEMNPDQLWETTMDPTKRTILRVSADDALEADRVFSLLMGDAVAPRRAFIQAGAKMVRNLDV